MKKTILKSKFVAIFILATITMSLYSCTNPLKNGTNDNDENPEMSSTIYVSNLKDDKSIKLLDSIFEKASISQERQKIFWDHVMQMNDVVGDDLIESDFESLPIEETKYDPYDLADKWNMAYPDFMGYNCRITAFSLFKDFINTKDITICGENEPDMIIFDLDSLDIDSSALLGKNDLNEFEAMYMDIPAKKTLDTNVHVATVQDFWKNKGISFQSTPKVSLISMFFYNDINEDNPTLFVGHTGLLFNVEKDGLYFLEKIAFQEPYQLIKFKNRNELNHYLMTKLYKSTQENVPKPFIMENDKLMNGYKV